MSTLKDVARLAGVSPSTVSRVVNGGSTGAASEETVRRIWDAVRESGYSVNENARSLRMKEEGGVKETLAIDCVFARDLDSFIDPFFMVLMQIIEADAFKRGYRLRYQYPIGDLKSVPLPDAKKKAAAIILGRTDKAHLELLKGTYRHLVYVSLQDKDLDVDSVICSGYDAMVKGLEYLWSLGHRKICYVGETVDEQRYDAYHDVMQKYAGSGCEELVIEVPFNSAHSYEAVNRALDEGMKFTAVFCSNDISSVGVYRALKKHRLSVPRDVSVIGLNDLEYVRYLDPMLTSVRVPMEELGRHAASLLIDRIENGHSLPVKLMIPSELVTRESCAKVRKPTAKK